LHLSREKALSLPSSSQYLEEDDSDSSGSGSGDESDEADQDMQRRSSASGDGGLRSKPIFRNVFRKENTKVRERMGKGDATRGHLQGSDK
jgi:hypothetical protein